jgi:hypothetical protein
MKSKQKIKNVLKELFLTKEGWLSIILANVFWSMFWFPFLVIWFIGRDSSYLLIATSVYLFFWQPLIPMWLIIPLTAVFIKTKILKNNVILKKGEQYVKSNA